MRETLILRAPITIMTTPEEETTFDRLQQEFTELSPKERNEKLQALFSARLAGRTDLDDLTIDLFNALMKSFGISARFDEIDESEGELFGTVSIDIRAARDESTPRLDTISGEGSDNSEPVSG